jgi:dihydroorotate dehydrogenase
MALTFANAVGLAAGIDRTGRNLASLAETGVGHVEVGTVTDSRVIALNRASLPYGFRVGVNFASPRPGIDATVIEDYAGLMRALWSQADYLVANLSSPSAGRTGDTPGVEQLIERLAGVREALRRETGSCKPLLVKIRAGSPGTPLPRALAAAGRLGLHGVVLVTPLVERLAECCGRLGAANLISVGGIATAADAAARLAAGAKLVQTYSVFATEGPAGVTRLLGLKGQEARKG